MADHMKQMFSFAAAVTETATMCDKLQKDRAEARAQVDRLLSIKERLKLSINDLTRMYGIDEWPTDQLMRDLTLCYGELERLTQVYPGTVPLDEFNAAMQAPPVPL